MAGHRLGGLHFGPTEQANLQDGGADLVTLHVYSPALLRMGTYSLTSPDVIEFEDPVHEFCQGSGI